ncbi:MAG: DUF6600 domain-containing protein [Chitinophagales bacterium]
MKKLLSISLLSLLLVVSSGQKIMAQDVAVSYQTFYDNLSPYGQWVSDPQYGNVWVPNEGGDFRPYGSRGHWVMTDYGNTWVSDDPWGWACYHYGRWTYDPYYGWVWIPGYEWAPAWVTWRYGGGYCGWAPLGPGITIGMSFYCPDSWWIFVGPQYMYGADCYHHWRGPGYNTTYIQQTTIINNYYVDNGTHVRYNYGPRRDVIERDTHQPVQVYRVSQTNRPGAPSVNGNRVSMYRPPVNRETANTARPGNVIQAPRQIGKPQPATTVNATHQAPFRQDVQKQTPGNIAPRPGNNNQPQPPVNRAQPQNNQPQPPVRNQPPADNKPQPQHFNNQPPARQQPAPQPQPVPRQQPAPQPRPTPQPAPRTQPAPQPRPMPQPAPRTQPAPQPRPAPQEQPHEGGRR